MIDDFIERKWGRRAVEYMLPELEPILRETLGVMRLPGTGHADLQRHRAATRSGGADLLRRAMGKKDAAEMEKQREIVHGRRRRERSIPRTTAGEIFDLMAQFAGYGFNKSHSAAYALLAYHTAWLKTHYPVEFMAALLTSETSKPENVVKYISECREMNIAVVPPDVQVSDANFTPIDRTATPSASASPPSRTSATTPSSPSSTARAALQAEGKPGFAIAVGVLREGRPAPAEQARAGVAHQGRRDGLPSAAAPQVMAALDKAMERAQKSQKDAAAGQHGLFGIFDADPVAAAASSRRRAAQRARVGRAHAPAERERSPRLLRLRPSAWTSTARSCAT